MGAAFETATTTLLLYFMDSLQDAAGVRLAYQFGAELCAVPVVTLQTAVTEYIYIHELICNYLRPASGACELGKTGTAFETPAEAATKHRTVKSSPSRCPRRYNSYSY